MLKLQETGS